jgi:inosine/xanthosine triphosphate pyrophosphatase family protein
MNISKIKLVTSNKFKLTEYNRFGLNLEIQEGLDLKEVDGTSEEVVIYKAIEAGENNLVEDTILMINGAEVVDIRNKIDDLADIKDSYVVWIVSLAVLQNGKVYIATAMVKGTLKQPAIAPVNSFGFDPYFYPANTEDGLSLHQLELIGKKDSYSARKRAINYFLNKGDGFYSLDQKDIKEWTGDYQKIDH